MPPAAMAEEETVDDINMNIRMAQMRPSTHLLNQLTIRAEAESPSFQLRLYQIRRIMLWAVDLATDGINLH